MLIIKCLWSLFFQMFLQLLIIQFLFFPNWIEPVQVGSIRNMFLSSTAVNVIPMNDSCITCICTMLLSINIIGVSCSSNQTCLLFYNYSLPYTLINSLTSSFHFLIPPPEQEYSTYKPIQTTQMSSEFW
jgi:hypothetical protein